MKRILILWLAASFASFGAVQYSFTNLAGLPGYFNSGTNDGTGRAARFSYPIGVAVDSAGNVFVADQNNSTIRKVTAAGVVTTLAGNPMYGGSEDGTNGDALFSNPAGVAVDHAGNVFVADTYNHTIRKVTPVGTNWVVTTLAGNPTYSGVSDGTNGDALFSNPAGVAVDNVGNVYVADQNNSTIRKVAPVGTNWVVTTLAGNPMYGGSEDGTNSAAHFSQPAGVAVDSAGNLYVADTFNNAIRKVTPVGTNWVVSTLAGGIEDFSTVSAVAVDSAGTVFVADLDNHTIRMVTAAGAVTTAGGSAGSYGTNDGVGGAARFYGPSGVAVDGAGNLYVSDTYNNRISKGTPSLTITTPSPLPSATLAFPYSQTLTAIGGKPPYSWSIAAGSLPAGLSLSTNGVISGTASAVASASFEVRVTGTNGQYATSSFSLTVVLPTMPVITTSSPLPEGTATKAYEQTLTAIGGMTPYVWSIAAGNLPPGLSLGTNGVVSGTPSTVTNASFSVRVTGYDGLASTNPFALAIVPPPPPTITTSSPLPDGQAYTIYSRMLAATGGTAPYLWSIASGNLPTGLSLSTNGVISGIPLAVMNAGFGVRVTGNDGLASVKLFALTITAPSPGYFFTNYAGWPGYSHAGTNDGTGGAARFVGPYGVAVDSAGNLYVADTFNYTIRKVAAGGVVTTLAGSAGVPGSDDGTNRGALFNQPVGLALDGAGNLYVADSLNCTLRKLSPVGTNWVVTTLAGDPQWGNGIADGTNSTARFNYPSGVAVDAAGNLYVADTYNNTIRKVTPVGTNWVTTTLAGSSGASGSADGTNGAARFSNPYGLTVDRAGRLFVTDSMNSTIRKVTPVGTNWVTTTLAGSPGYFGGEDGANSEAHFSQPGGVAVDSAGNLFVTDTMGYTIRKVTPAGTNWVVTTVGGLWTAAGTNDGVGSAARFADVFGVAIDSAGNLYLADASNNRISKGTRIGPPEITSSDSLPPGLVGSAYSQTLTASGGSQPLTWSITAGTLPPGLSLSTNGVISGTPGAGMTVTFTVKATGLDALSSEQAVHLTIVPVPGQTYSYYAWTNFAGQRASAGYADGTSNQARFNDPRGLAVDGRGNVYVSDTLNNVIRKVSPDGVVTTFAGKAGQAGSTDGTGNDARFNAPYGASVDGSGNLYVADTGNHTIRKVSPDRVVTTLAGSPGAPGYADGDGNAARFNTPWGVTVDGSGNLYVADTGNHMVRKVNPDGAVTTLAGVFSTNASGYPQGGYADGPGSIARFSGPRRVAVDGTGNVYVADAVNCTIRKIRPDGVVTTLAGLAGSYGTTDGTGSDARFHYPSGVAVDGDGNVYVTDGENSTVRKVTPAGVVTTLAGLGGNYGSTDGTGSAARFNRSMGVAVDSSNQVYVADSYNNTIRKVSSAGVVTTLAGYAWPSYYREVDGTGEAAQFWSPIGAALDSRGNLYVSSDDTIRKVSPAAAVTTLAGLANHYGSTDGTNSDASFYGASGLAVDGSGNVYVAEFMNQTIRKVSPVGTNWVVTPLAGDPTIVDPFYNEPIGGYADGTNRSARFNYPRGTAVDGSGNLYVADSGNCVIRKVSPAGVVTTLAGLAGNTGTADGTGDQARFLWPSGVALDGSGNLYVADSGNCVIRKVSPAGVVTTLAGLAGNNGTADGTGDQARFYHPDSVAVDSSGNVFVTDQYNRTIRKISPAGGVTTIGGTPGMAGSADGLGRDAGFAYPSGVAVAPDGSVYVVDQGENRVIKGTPVSSPSITTPTALPHGLIGTAYHQTLIASGGALPRIWYITSGSLPPGLSLSSDGVISGTPTGMTNLTFTLCVIGGDGLAFADVFSLATSAARPNLQLGWSSGLPRLNISGSVAGSYIVETSSNLFNWQPVSTNLVPAGGSLWITNLTSSNSPMQFYRALNHD